MIDKFLSFILAGFFLVGSANAATVDTLPLWATGGSLIDSIVKEFQGLDRHLGIGTTGSFPIIGGQNGYRAVTIEGKDYGGAVIELANKNGNAASEVGKIEVLNLDSVGNIIGRALINVIADEDATRLGIGTAIQTPGDADAYYTTFVRYSGDMGIGTTYPNVNGQARALTISAKGEGATPRVGTGAIEIIGNRQGADGAVALIDFENESDGQGGPQRIASILALRVGVNDQGELSFYTKGDNGLEKWFTISPNGDVTFWKLQSGSTSTACIHADGRLVRC